MLTMLSKFKGIPIGIVLLKCLILASALNDQIIVKMDRADVFDAINSVMKSSYIKQLTKEFASRAADSFIDEIKRRQFLVDLKRLEKHNRSNRNSDSVYESTPRPPRNDILDEAKAKILLENPYMDGDNLDPLGDQILSDAEVDKEFKPKPISKLTRINGAYFRRLLGFLVQNKGFLKEIEF